MTVRMFIYAYPYPVPFRLGCVKKFFPDDLYSFPGLFEGLKAVIGPANVP